MRVGDLVGQLLIAARPASGQEVLHVKLRGVHSALGALFHHQLVALALERLETLIVHCRPAFGTVEQVSDLDVQRRASLRGGHEALAAS